VYNFVSDIKESAETNGICKQSTAEICIMLSFINCPLHHCYDNHITDELGRVCNIHEKKKTNGNKTVVRKPERKDCEFNIEVTLKKM
jgi:hypothetical protein